MNDVEEYDLYQDDVITGSSLNVSSTDALKRHVDVLKLPNFSTAKN